MRSPRRLHIILASFVTAIAFLTYWRTIAPTTSFWDCGEFIACSYILGVPHPPGAPLYLLVGRVFSMIPFAADIGLRVNMISALASTFTVLFTYLIIVRPQRQGQDNSLQQWSDWRPWLCLYRFTLVQRGGSGGVFY